MVDKIRDLCCCLSGSAAAGGADPGQRRQSALTEGKKKTERGKRIMPFNKTYSTDKEKEKWFQSINMVLCYTPLLQHIVCSTQRVWRGTETQPGAPKKVWSQNWRNYRLDRCCTRMESEGGG